MILFVCRVMLRLTACLPSSVCIYSWRKAAEGSCLWSQKTTFGVWTTLFWANCNFSKEPRCSDSSVGWTVRYSIADRCKNLRPDRLWTPPSLLCNGYRKPRSEADYSPPSSLEVKNEWSCISTPFLRLHDVHQDIFTFYLLPIPQTLFPKFTFNAIGIIFLVNPGFEAVPCLLDYRSEVCMLHLIST
jgi:hypothetical protein